MQININGEALDLQSGASIKLMLSIIGCPEQGAAVAINDTIVPRHLWGHTLLAPADNVLVIKAASGG
jgi:sulfur carrier protein